MLTNTGHYDRRWLHNQPIQLLRYEARAEKLAGWDCKDRSWLLVALGQCRPANLCTKVSIGQHQT